MILSGTPQWCKCRRGKCFTFSAYILILMHSVSFLILNRIFFLCLLSYRWGVIFFKGADNNSIISKTFTCCKFVWSSLKVIFWWTSGQFSIEMLFLDLPVEVLLCLLALLWQTLDLLSCVTTAILQFDFHFCNCSRETNLLTGLKQCAKVVLVA